jgi:hypothetical protein
MRELAKESLTRLFVNGELQYFYNLWSEHSKTCITLIDFGRVLAQSMFLNGKFTAIGEPEEPKLRMGSSNVWLMVVPMFAGDIEFFAKISFNEEKQICDFQFARCLKYHRPEWIKSDRFERIVLHESDPRTIFTKPLRATEPAPVAMILHFMAQATVDIRMGYCFIGLDWEYLACANIGLIRTEYTQDMVDTADPVLPFATKCMEAAMQVPDATGFYIIVWSYVALYLDAICNKFPGSVDGIVLVNPVWYAPPGSPMASFSEDRVPKDIPILLIGSGMDELVEPSNFKKWKAVIEKMGCEAVLYDKCDHFLIGCNDRPRMPEYSMVEKHVSDVPLRKIAQWIRRK